MRASNLGMPNSGRILADVYYHTSSGQKLRSRPEVAAFLAANPEVPLTVDHFTFVRTPIYRPPLELVRKAAPRGNAMPVPETAVALAEESKRTASVPCELGQHHASVDNTTGRRVARKRLCCCEEQCSGSKQLRSSENTQFQPSFWQDHALPAGETRLANKHFLKRHGLQKAATELLGEQLRHAAKVDNVQATSPKKLSGSLVAASNNKSRPRKVTDTQPSNLKSASPPRKQVCSPQSSPSDDDKVMKTGPSSPSKDSVVIKDGAANDSVEILEEIVAPSSMSSQGKPLRQFRISKHLQATSPISEPSAVTLVSSSSKRPVVVVRDFLKGGELSDLSLGEDKRTPPKEATLVTPHVRSDYWRNTAAWDIYKVLKARQNGSTPGNRDKSPVAVEVRLTDISTDRAVLDEDVAQASQAPPVQCLPSVVQSKQPAFIEASSMQREQTVELCNLRCPKAIDETPQLLCTRCLCLFHPVCVGMTNSHPAAAKGRFICKACTKKPYKASGMSGSTEQASISENITASSKNTSSKPEVTLLRISKENTAKTMPSKAIASSTAAPVNTQCLSFSTTSTVTSTVPSSLSDSPVGVKSTLALSSSSSISVPVFHVVSSGPRPSTSGTPLRHVAQRPRLPFLLPAPVPPMTSGNVKEMPALKVQSKGPQNLTVVPSVYYTIQVTQKPGSINGEELKSLVNQLVQKHPEELNKMGSGETIVLQTPSLSLQAAKTVQPAGSPIIVREHPMARLPVMANVQAANLSVTSTHPLIATEAVTAGPLPSNFVEAVLGDGGQTLPARHIVAGKSLLRAPRNIGNVTVMSTVALQKPAMPLQDTTCAATTMVPSSQHQCLVGVGVPTIGPQKPVCNISSVPAVSVASAQCPVTSGTPQTSCGKEIVPKLEQCPVSSGTPQTSCGKEIVPKLEVAAQQSALEEESFSMPVGTESSKLGAVFVGPPDCEVSAFDASQVITEGETIYGLDTLPVDPQPSCIITSSYSLAGEHSEASLWQSCDESEADGAVGNTQHHLPNAVDETVTVEKPAANTEQVQLKEAPKIPVPCSLKSVKPLRSKSKRHHRVLSSTDSSGASVWVYSDGQLTCVRDKPKATVRALQLENAVPNCSRDMQSLTDCFTALNHILQWLPAPSLCKVAQVCRAWRMFTQMPHLWKRVDFRRLRVHDWNACVAKLKRMQSEELVLDRDSLDPVLSKAKHLEAVQHVEVEVNSLQLVDLGEAFSHLRSLSAVITRKAPIAKGGAGERSTQRHPASLGGLSELLCATGLERLELSGAHGLALLPLTMPTHSLAQRCQHLRALSLLTVKSMSPAMVFLVSLLRGLEELHLGDCVNWSEISFVNIGKLKQLRWLTLERGEDNDGFRTMLLRLEKLQRLDLKQWTLRNSLADTLCKMNELRRLLFWPLTTGSTMMQTLRTNRNILRSCLAVGSKLEKVTWIVNCKLIGAPFNVQPVALDVNLAFEYGTLCQCPTAIATSYYARVLPPVASDNAKGPQARKSIPKSTEAEPCSSSEASPAHRAHCRSLAEANFSTSSKHSQELPPCCALAKTLLEVWKPNMHRSWQMTLRQLCQGLKHCLGPKSAVCICIHVEQ
ncbi:uncharacterized protein LOC119167684 isoform X2 [Rhipicephalus microplus]